MRVEKKVENEITAGDKPHRDRLLAVIDSSEKRSRRVIRKDCPHGDPHQCALLRTLHTE